MNNSRNTVTKALKFDSPSRIPRDMWVLPWAQQSFPHQLNDIQTRFPSDIVCSPSFLKQPPHTVGDPYAVGTFIDEWGCVFENRHAGIIGEVKEPLLQDFNIDLRIPNELLTVDIQQVNAFCAATNEFVLAGTCPRPFERLQFLRGTPDTLMDLALETPALLDLLQQIHNFNLKDIELWARTDVDALRFMDDWGSQQSLLISPNLWRKHFKPLYMDYIDIARHYKKFIFMHSDGFILDIIPDLIELGLDALNSQVFCMGVKELGNRFRGKITFWGELDRQSILPFGSLQDVITAAKSMKEQLSYNGGLIAQMEFGPGTKPENVAAFFENI